MAAEWARFCGEEIHAVLIQAANDAQKLEEIEYGTGGYAQRLMDAIEGECDGLSIDEFHATAILGYVMTGMSSDELETARTPKEQTK
jgi:hypothetical protein